MNILASKNVPAGITVRRNFTFAKGDKHPLNRLYRSIIDRWLISRFRCVDLFFSMTPITKPRLLNLISLSQSVDVEIMVHPAKDPEYRYLLSPEWGDMIRSSNLQAHSGHLVSCNGLLPLERL
jgi:hypothetical protein